jgi:hypothetical protein
MTNLKGNLESAIEGLYETFARYPQPERVEYCPCGCTKPDEVAPLLAAPLRALRFTDLGNYCFSAMTTQGSVDDFRHFLPRMFQGAAEEEFAYNLEILFGKLSYAKWLTWPEGEIAAVRTYLTAIWRFGIDSFPIEQSMPGIYEIETLLASIACTGEALGPYLQVWTETKTLEADRNLVQFVTMYGADFSDGKTLSVAFWERAAPAGAELRNWLLRPDTLDRVSRSAHLVPIDGFEQLFEPAIAILRAERRTTCP